MLLPVADAEARRVENRVIGADANPYVAIAATLACGFLGIRSPVAPPSARRIENRVIGADANPYVALAATLACGWLGIRDRIEPTPECKGDAYLGDFQLPRNLGDALALLRAERELAAILGESFITVYTEVKEIEHAEFMKVISPWEREHLLLHV